MSKQLRTRMRFVSAFTALLLTFGPIAAFAADAGELSDSGSETTVRQAIENIDISAVDNIYAAAAVSDNAHPASVTLAMRAGEAGFVCDGAEYGCPAPMLIDGAVFFPFRAIAEAFGAGIDYIEAAEAPQTVPAGNSGGAKIAKEDEEAEAAVDFGYPRIDGGYMDRQFTYIIGDDGFYLNGEKNENIGPLRVIGDTTYIPAGALDLFLQTQTVYDQDTGAITISMEDDGSIHDLSELLGEISENAIADSYFNWRIDIPKKSILLMSSFNGDEIVIYSPLREAFIQIVVKPSEKEALEYYLDNKNKISDDFYVDTAEIIETDDDRYVQATFTDYGLNGIMRLYVRPRYDYQVMIISMPDDYDYIYSYYDPSYEAEDLTNDSPFTKILDSFRIGGFDGDDRNVRDLTKIIGDRIEYESQVNIPESKTLLSPWAVSILPSWSVLYTPRTTGAATALGADRDENLSVTIEALPADITIDEYFDNYADLEKDRFNEKLYKLISCKPKNSDDYPSIDIVYSLNNGEDTFYYIDRLMYVGKILFRLRVKMPEERYINKKATFYSILDSFTIRSEGITKISENIIKQYASYKKLKLSADGAPADVENSDDEWKSVLPGDWVYYDRRTSASVALRSKIDYSSQGIYWNNSFYFDAASGANINIIKTDMGALAEMLVRAKLGEGMSHFISGELSGEPEEKEFGENKYNVFTYTRKVKNINYMSQYPGYDISGKLYIYTDEKTGYLIYAEVPAIFDAPSNTAGFDMFLKEFVAGVKYRGDEPEDGDDKTGAAKPKNADDEDFSIDMEILMEILNDLYQDGYSATPDK